MFLLAAAVDSPLTPIIDLITAGAAVAAIVVSVVALRMQRKGEHAQTSLAERMTVIEEARRADEEADRKAAATAATLAEIRAERLWIHRPGNSGTSDQVAVRIGNAGQSVARNVRFAIWCQHDRAKSEHLEDLLVEDGDLGGFYLTGASDPITLELPPGESVDAFFWHRSRLVLWAQILLIWEDGSGIRSKRVKVTIDEIK